ncbi:MAG: META domain-containing protein [Chloroflexi bacterium]|nr:META domain-containing protein [Chloroflexota bacterium]
MMIKQLFALLLVTVALVLAACIGTGNQPLDLNGTAWVLTHLNGQPVLDGSPPTIRFENGQASGNASCNSFGGDYTQRGDKLTFEALMSTLMACFPEEIMQQEQAYLSALASTASYQLEGDRLTLFDADGNVLAEFVAAE